MVTEDFLASQMKLKSHKYAKKNFNSLAVSLIYVSYWLRNLTQSLHQLQLYQRLKTKKIAMNVNSML
jgi:hypothetical protein